MISKFHAGELAVQARAGVVHQAERIGNGLHPTIPPVARKFLEEQRMAVIGTQDREGRVWASLLTGKPGFIRALDETTIRIDAVPTPGDPLETNLQKNGEAGMLVIDLATRRRMRVNGRAEFRPGIGIFLQTRQVFSNCPKYIQVRHLEYEESKPVGEAVISHSATLYEKQQQWITQADTFFIATAHSEGGADASHRGGFPGFVKVLDSRTLAFPDYAGNNMFQTLGNLAENPQAGLLFLDFERGTTLQLTGKAKVSWDQERLAEFVGAQRVIEFEVEEAIEIEQARTWRWQFDNYSPFIPVG